MTGAIGMVTVSTEPDHAAMRQHLAIIFCRPMAELPNHLIQIDAGGYEDGDEISFISVRKPNRKSNQLGRTALGTGNADIVDLDQYRQQGWELELIKGLKVPYRCLTG